MHKQCDVAECNREARSRIARYCEKHYYRVRRTGTTDVTRPQRPMRGPCSMANCESLDAGPHGLCKMHYSRYVRHGDPLRVVRPEPLRGAANGNWVGDRVKVKGAHMRVTAERGPASIHLCVDCGNTAAHWSYDHEDPNEQQSNHGPYSADTTHYFARCVPCHKKFDLDRV